MSTSKRYSPEVRERAVRLVFEQEGQHESQWAAIGSIAAKIGCTAETLRSWGAQAERDRGTRASATSEERERIKSLEREVRELRQANEVLRKGETLSAIGPRTMSSAYSDGVDTPCLALSSSPSLPRNPPASSPWKRARRRMAGAGRSKGLAMRFDWFRPSR